MVVIRNKSRERKKAREIGTTRTCDETELLELVGKAADGNVDAFGELYSIYVDRIYRYVFNQVRDKMAVEDLTEEIFVKAWKALGGYKRQSPTFTAWLYRIAHNHVVDYFRTRRQHQSLEEEMPTTVSGPEQEAEENIMQQELVAAISCLPPQQKQIMLLKFIEGLDNCEIAQIMRKRQGAIRVMQMRALATLRQKFSGERTNGRQAI